MKETEYERYETRDEQDENRMWNLYIVGKDRG